MRQKVGSKKPTQPKCLKSSQLFQLKAQYLVEELLSPLVTPYVLYFHIRPKAVDLVHFFATNTRYVEGVGDVCSYSMMDITRDGDLRLAPLNQSVIDNPVTASNKPLRRVQTQNSCGKIELSLLNFATLNPGWEPSPAATSFINNVKELVAQEICLNPENAQLPLQCSLQDLETSMRQTTMTGGRDLTMSMAAFGSKSGQAIRENSNAARSLSKPLEEPSTIVRQEEDDGDEASPPSSFLATSSKPGSNLVRQSSLPTVGKGLQKDGSVAASTNDGPSHSGIRTSQRGSMINSSVSGLAQSTTPSDFIHPLSLGPLVQPRNVQENNTRAMEMSANALALNRMLMSSFSLAAAPPRTHGYDPLDSLRTRPHFGYGAFATNAASCMLQHQSIGASRYGAVTGSIAASNLWGVPQVSTIVSMTENDGEQMDQQPLRANRASLYRPGTAHRRSQVGLEEEDVGHDHLDPMTP